MFKLILVLIFFLLTISPTFAIIEFRDTTPVQICDTIIYEKGIVAVIKLFVVCTLSLLLFLGLVFRSNFAVIFLLIAFFLLYISISFYYLLYLFIAKSDR